MLRPASLVSLLTLLSRVLGLVREQAFAALLGAGLHADAFQIAFRIPNLLRDLFAEGALSAAFVPTYARVLAEDGREAAYRLASRLFTLLALVLGVVVVFGILFADPIVAALAPGFEAVPGKVERTVLLTRIMFPFLPLVSFAAVAMGMLNAEERFGFPALAPAMFNVVAVAWGLALWALGFDLDHVAVGWALGTLVGGLAQFGIQLPPLWRRGFGFRAQWAPEDPGIRTIGGLMVPATLGLAAVQINIFVSSIYASQDQGAVSWLNYAFRILYLPIGIFGVAVSTIATAGLARRAAVGDMEGVRETLRQGLRMVAFLTVPATAGLMVLGEPIVRLLYQRGRFSAADTHATAVALFYCSVGLVAYTVVKVVAPAFYALGSPRVPLLASAAAVVTNLVTIALLYDRIGYRGVALGMSSGSVVNAAVLVAAFHLRMSGLVGHGLGRALGRMVAASIATAAVAWGSAALLAGIVGIHGLMAQAVTCLVPVALGVLAYLAGAHALGLPEVRALLSLLRSFGRR